MKIAVTGGTGFIGQWLLKLLSDKYEIIILGRDMKIKSFKSDDKEFQYISTDYSIEQLLQQLQNVDAVVHLAAKKVDLEKDKETFEKYLCNIIISSNLFEACRRLNIKNVINLSSRTVYSHKNQMPWQEDICTYPQNFYGISKLTIDNIAHYYNNTYNLNIKTLRVAQVLGWGEREGFMIMEFIKRAINNEPITVYGNGEGRREYIYIKDLIRAIHASINKPEIRGIFNIGSGNNISHFEFAKSINKVFNNEGNILMLSNKIEDKSVNLMCIKKAERELGWNPIWTIEDALYDMRENKI